MNQAATQRAADKVARTLLASARRVQKLTIKEEALRRRASLLDAGSKKDDLSIKATKVFDQFTKGMRGLMLHICELKGLSPIFREDLTSFSFLVPFADGPAKHFPLGERSFNPRRFAEEMPLFIKRLELRFGATVGRKKRIPYTKSDRLRYKRIGDEKFKLYSDSELWERSERQEKNLNSKITKSAFRSSCYRIRKHFPTLMRKNRST